MIKNENSQQLEWGDLTRLANELGCSISRLSNYRKGIRTPHPVEAVRLSQAIYKLWRVKVSWEDLVFPEKRNFLKNPIKRKTKQLE